MGIFEEIKRMREEGKSDQDVTVLLQESGYGIKEVSDALNQSKIKQAVSDPMDTQQIQYSSQQYSSRDPEMMASIANIPTENGQSEEIANAGNVNEPQKGNYHQEYAPQTQQPPQAQYQPEYQPVQGQQQYYQQDYQTYQPNDQAAYNAETISEIAEQVMAEKIMSIKKQLEMAIDLRNTTETKLNFIDERLKHLEKIIDRLQLSILQKVGEYVTNVEDIKKEMVETQKSFKSMAGQKAQHAQHTQRPQHPQHNIKSDSQSEQPFSKTTGHQR